MTSLSVRVTQLAFQGAEKASSGGERTEKEEWSTTLPQSQIRDKTLQATVSHYSGR